MQWHDIQTKFYESQPISVYNIDFCILIT